MVAKCRSARFGPPTAIAPVGIVGAGKTAVAGGGLAATVWVITRRTVSTDWVVRLEETTTVVGLTPAAAAAPKCARASPHSALSRASVMDAQVLVSAAALMVA